MILDRLGIFGSVVCSIHCALPLILSFVSPSVSSFFGNEIVHYVLLASVIPMAFFSFLISKKFHNKYSPLILGILGIVFLITAVSVDSPFGSQFPNFELLTTLGGSSILILSHFLNLQFMKKSRLID